MAKIAINAVAFLNKIKIIVVVQSAGCS